MGLMSPLTACQHDGAAVLLRNGKVKFCGEEERYVRYKHARGHIPIDSISAGLKFCKSDLTLIIDADLQDPPDLLKEMFDKLKNEKANCVYGKRISRKDTFFKKDYQFFINFSFTGKMPINGSFSNICSPCQFSSGNFYRFSFFEH